jgi:hypothetical protein
MGLFSPFVYKSKDGQKFWLHVREKGKQKLFYFSREPDGALHSLPKGFEISENPLTGLPMLKRKTTSLFGLVETKPEKEGEEKVEKTKGVKEAENK